MAWVASDIAVVMFVIFAGGLGDIFVTEQLCYKRGCL